MFKGRKQSDKNDHLLRNSNEVCEKSLCFLYVHLYYCIKKACIVFNNKINEEEKNCQLIIPSF